MVKLSRRTWNNLIIFSMLILIFLFYSTSNFLNGGSSNKPQTHLLPADSVISTLDFGDYKVERIGQGWRAIGINVQHNDLVKLNEHWLNAEFMPTNSDLSLSQASASHSVTVWLLGQKEPLKLEIFDIAGKTLVLSQQHLYQLRSTAFDSLVLKGDKDA